MSDDRVAISPEELVALQARVLSYYFAIVVLALIGIGILVAYAIGLGPLVGPGVEESFGLSIALLFLFAALLVHVLDRSYREWPLGRRVHPSDPKVITDATVAGTLRVAVLVGAGLVIAYILAQLLTG